MVMAGSPSDWSPQNVQPVCRIASTHLHLDLSGDKVWTFQTAPKPMPRAFSVQLAERVSSDRFYATEDRIPVLPGAYLLLIELREVIFVWLPNKPSVILASGRYIYAGSAYGPGGLKARVSRHMRRAKARRWRIDQLTETGNVIGASVFHPKQTSGRPTSS